MEIIWSNFAINSLKGIFDYYSINVNRKVAYKIKKQILASTKQLISNPKSGQTEFYLDELKQNHRYILTGNYKVIYRIDKETIFINDVFDVRQNPNKMIGNKRIK